MILAVLVAGGCSSVNYESSEEREIRHRNRPVFLPFRLHSDGKQCRAEWKHAPPLQPDLWGRLKTRYQLGYIDNDRITRERNWYTSHQSYLDRMSGRASRYLYYVTNKLEERQMPGELALLPIVESAYNPFALSRSQASGLWQFIPSTAKHLKMDMNWWYDARRDIPASTDTALDYLAFLRDHYNGDWLKALAAYNAGWGTIDRAVEKNRAKGLPTDYWSLDVPDETRAYVPKLLALAQITRDPGRYGVHWAYIPDLPYFAEIHLQNQLDITLAADMANVSSDELYLLNPGISRWATPPGGSYRLLVPVDQANEFQERIAGVGTFDRTPMNNLSHETRMSASNPMVQDMEKKSVVNKPAPTPGNRTYVVKAGDTLWSVAKKSGMTPDALRKLNKLEHDEPLKLGQTLTLPGSTRIATTSPTNAGKTDARQKSLAQTGKSTPAQSGKTAYAVQRGDTLMAIARKYKLDVNDIARWNSLDKHRATLKPGQMLTLYLDPGSKH